MFYFVRNRLIDSKKSFKTLWREERDIDISFDEWFGLFLEFVDLYLYCMRYSSISVGSDSPENVVYPLSVELNNPPATEHTQVSDGVYIFT